MLTSYIVCLLKPRHWQWCNISKPTTNFIWTSQLFLLMFFCCSRTPFGSRISYLVEVMFYARVSGPLKFLYPMWLMDLLLITCALCDSCLRNGPLLQKGLTIIWDIVWKDTFICPWYPLHLSESMLKVWELF